MNEFITYWKKMNGKQKIIALYFCASFAMLSLTTDSSIAWVLVIMINFCNAARLTNQLPHD